MEGNDLGGDPEKIKWLAEGIKKLPNYLKNFKLELSYNNLGGNANNMKWLGQGIKYLP